MFSLCPLWRGHHDRGRDEWNPWRCLKASRGSWVLKGQCSWNNALKKVKTWINLLCKSSLLECYTDVSMHETSSNQQGLQMQCLIISKHYFSSFEWVDGSAHSDCTTLAFIWLQLWLTHFRQFLQCPVVWHAVISVLVWLICMHFLWFHIETVHGIFVL